MGGHLDGLDQAWPIYVESPLTILMECHGDINKIRAQKSHFVDCATVEARGHRKQPRGHERNLCVYVVPGCLDGSEQLVDILPALSFCFRSA